MRIIKSSTAASGSAKISGTDTSVGTYVFEVVDEDGSFAGTTKIAARARGRGNDGAADYPNFLAITNRTTGAIVDGDTGVSDAGIFSVDITGFECELQVTRTAGEYSVHGDDVVG